jgi:KipI family sensor histidine kinase inhibitor
MTAAIFPRLTPVGDMALLLQLGDRIDPQLNARVHTLAHSLAAMGVDGLGECVPGYASLLVNYDPLRLKDEEVAARIFAALDRLDEIPESTSRIIEIPVVYGGEFGPDLEEVAIHNHITPADVVCLHSQPIYSVYFIGFLPGFPYLGGLDPAIACPRLETPRSVIPAGSVGIAGNQTGIYPSDSPGGWRIIGSTPLQLFDWHRQAAALLSPGDSVKFFPIPAEEFEHVA